MRDPAVLPSPQVSGRSKGDDVRVPKLGAAMSVYHRLMSYYFTSVNGIH